MNQFIERFKEHPIHSQLQAVRDGVRNARASLALQDEQQRIGYLRFLRAFRHVEYLFAQVDPMLVTPSTLNQLQKTLTNLNDQHQAFLDDKNGDALNNQVDAVLDQLYRLPHRAAYEGHADFAKALEDYRQTVEVKVAEVDKSSQDALQQHHELTQQIAQAKERLDQQDQQFEMQKGRLEQLITDQQAKFNEEQQQRNNQFSENRDRSKQEFSQVVGQGGEQVESFLDSSKSSFDALVTETKERAGNTVEELQDRLDHAKHLVGLISDTSMAGHYQNVANRDKKAAGIFRWLAVAFFLVMVVMVFLVVWGVQADNFSWEVALFRFAVAVTLLAPAIYCARESSKHRTIENRNRRIELELASINPYLDRLDDGKANEIVEKLAHEYFGNKLSESDGKPGDAFRDVWIRGDQLLTLAERIAKIIK